MFLFFYFLLVLGCASSEKNPDTAILHLRLGTNYLTQGSYPAALVELLRAEELDPQNPIVQNNLGLTYFMRQKYDLAQKHISRAIELDAKYSEAKNNLARVYIELKLFNEARLLTDQVLNDLTYPTPYKAHLNKGLSYFKQNAWDEARLQFIKALESDKENCLGMSLYGKSLLELKQNETAAKAFDKAVVFCKTDVLVAEEAWYFAGVAWYRANFTSQAMARFESLSKSQTEWGQKAKEMLSVLRNKR